MTKAMHRNSLVTSKLRRLCCSGSSFLHFLLIRSNQSINRIHHQVLSEFKEVF